jgi:hypothetical protein
MRKYIREGRQCSPNHHSSFQISQNKPLKMNSLSKISLLFCTLVTQTISYGTDYTPDPYEINGIITWIVTNKSFQASHINHRNSMHFLLSGGGPNPGWWEQEEAAYSARRGGIATDQKLRDIFFGQKKKKKKGVIEVV